MRRGLRFMNDARNEQAIAESVLESESACRELTSRYFSVMQDMVSRKNYSARHLMHMNFVPFGKFIARLYRALAGIPEMVNIYYTSMSSDAQQTLLRDTLRQVMEEAVVWPHGVTPPTIPPVPAFHASLFSTPMRPSDSVSNVIGRASKIDAASVVGQSVADKVVTSALQGGESEELSTDRLSAHKARHDTSRFSGFAPPSVASLRQSDVKEIEVSNMDPHASLRGPSSRISVATTDMSDV